MNLWKPEQNELQAEQIEHNQFNNLTLTSVASNIA